MQKIKNLWFYWNFLFISLSLFIIVLPQWNGKAFEVNNRNEQIAATGSNFYSLQAGTPAYIKNFAHPEVGCRWLGVSGQIFGTDGKPISGLMVKLRGSFNGKAVSKSSYTGASPIYGSGGYEIMIADSVANTRQSLWIEVYKEGVRLSERVFFDTYADCNRNLIMINFTTVEVTPTPTKTKVLPTATRTLTATITRTPTRTKTPTITRTPTITKTPIPSLTPSRTITPSLTPTEMGYLPFYEIVKGSPLYIRNLYRPSMSCQWMGVAGQIFDLQGRPVKNVVVEVNGRIDGKPFVGLSLSGTALAYGAGGFEIFLSPKPLDTQDNFYIFLRDLQGRRLSYHFPFDTYASCEKNLILFHFMEKQK